MLSSDLENIYVSMQIPIELLPHITLALIALSAVGFCYQLSETIEYFEEAIGLFDFFGLIFSLVWTIFYGCLLGISLFAYFYLHYGIGLAIDFDEFFRTLPPS